MLLFPHHIIYRRALLNRISHGTDSSRRCDKFDRIFHIRTKVKNTFADLEFLTQTSLSHIRISIACTPVNNFVMNGNIFGEIWV